MAKQKRRRLSWFKLTFSTLALAVVGGVVAWQQDWIPTEKINEWLAFKSGISGPESSAPELFAPPADATAIDPKLAAAQSEPPLDGAAQNAAAIELTGSAPKSRDDWYNEPTPEMSAAPPPTQSSAPQPFPEEAAKTAAAAPAETKAATPTITPAVAPAAEPENPFASSPQAVFIPAPTATVIPAAGTAPAEPSVSNQPDPFESATPSPAPQADARLQAIDRKIAEHEYIAAHRDLSKLYWNHPEMHAALGERIEKTARSIYFSPEPHYMDPYVIEPGDQLRKIAERYHVPWEYLAMLNQVEPQKIRAGQKLKVIKGPFSALIDLSEFTLTIHAHGYYVRRYQVGVGKDGSTPIGKFSVQNKVVNPQYTDPQGRVVAADNPSNPLGERWIDLGGSYGVHGTIDPGSIGKAESRGCVRMRNEEVEEVYNLLSLGSEVIIQK